VILPALRDNSVLHGVYRTPDFALLSETFKPSLQDANSSFELCFFLISPEEAPSDNFSRAASIASSCALIDH